MLTADYQPSFFIYFDINPESIDVNIHPTKTEIKFADEQAIFQILMASVREALGKFTLAPTIDFDTRGAIDIPAPPTEHVARPQVAVDPTYNPFHTRGTIYPDKAPRSWESLYEAPQSSRNIDIPVSRNIDIPEFRDAEMPLWQYNGKYILLPGEEGLTMIHQHRAHVMVLYHRFLDQMTHAQGASQQLLFPEVISLSPDDMVLVEQITGDLRAIGFDLEQLSPDSYSIQGVPAQIANQSPVPVLQQIIEKVRSRGADTQSEWREQIALSLAQSTAIPLGKSLSEQEMRQIVGDLMQLPSHRITPDGKTIVSLLTNEEIEKKF